jgi:hypothetical protein
MLRSLKLVTHVLAMMLVIKTLMKTAKACSTHQAPRDGEKGEVSRYRRLPKQRQVMGTACKACRGENTFELKVDDGGVKAVMNEMTVPMTKTNAKATPVDKLTSAIKHVHERIQRRRTSQTKTQPVSCTAGDVNNGRVKEATALCTRGGIL